MAPDDTSLPGPPAHPDDFSVRVTTIAALAEPARRDLYRFVVTQPGSVSREQAAAGAGVALHVAKFHLDKLVDEGLLDFDFRRPPGRRGPGAGRPSKVYRRSAHDFAVSLPERRYEFAAQLLARAVTDAERDGLPVAETLRNAACQAGLTWGEVVRRRGAPQTGEDGVVDQVVQALEDGGYEPRRAQDGVLLANCPFESLARGYKDLACQMNLDLLSGLLECLNAARFEARLDPGADRCCVRLQKR